MFHLRHFYIALVCCVTAFSSFAQEVNEAFLNELNSWGAGRYKPVAFGSITAYQLEAFPESQKNRNHWDDRAAGSVVNSVVIHHTASSTLRSVLSTFTQNQESGNVNAHFVVSPEGHVIFLAPLEKRTWHAGFSYWDDVTNLNATSIGIEMVNAGFSDGKQIPFSSSIQKATHFYAYPEAQVSAVVSLLQSLKQEVATLDPVRFVGHMDIAPGRKADPIWTFPWKHISQTSGLGMFISDEEHKQYLTHENCPRSYEAAHYENLLKRIGYGIGVTMANYKSTFRDADLAFRSHWSRAWHLEKLIPQMLESDPHLQSTKETVLSGPATLADLQMAWMLTEKYKGKTTPTN